MEHKKSIYKGLQFLDVWFTDTSLTSPDYFQITDFPTRLTAGKNIFKLRGKPGALKVGGYLNIEILDYNGSPIYYKIVDYIDEDKARVIAIYIYEDTSPGDCTITIIGESTNAPEDWQGRGNVKWTRTVAVNPNASNISEIVFEKLPQINITEQVGTHLDRVWTNGQYPTYSTGSVTYQSKNGQPVITLTGGKFTPDMATGTITVATPLNPSPTPNYPVSNNGYRSTIKKVLSPTSILLDQEYTVLTPTINNHTYTEFGSSSFSLIYESTPTYVATQNSESFAQIEIIGLEPATGDVSRIKTFMTNKGTVGDWELISDVELTETEIFVPTTASLYPDQSIGIFTSQSVINSYWTGSTYLGATISTAPTLTWTSASMQNAMSIVSATPISQNNQVHIVQTKEQYAGIFIASSSYKVTLDAIGTRSTDGLNPKLSVYLSGSATTALTNDLFNQELPKKLGKRLGFIEVLSDSQRFDDHVINFDTEYSGTGTLILVIESGTWQVADIRVTTDNDPGYTPNYTRIKTLVPTSHKSNNQLAFKVEYYNVAGERCKQSNISYNIDWEGGNRYIDGEYSMLTGSLYVADSLESGIAISGYTNSGFVRSLGYEGFDAGFPGFLLWSGSALNGQTSKGSAYSGVGLELYANTASYFRYSTRDNEIDVRTKTYFFGDPNSTYISGSNGLLEISSSNFLLSSSGDVFANDANFSGTAQANIILDKSIRITTTNSGSYLQQYTITATGQTAYRLVLDGTLGGNIVRKVEIQPILNYPIGEIKTPAIGSTKRLDVTISSLSSVCSIYDKFTNKYGIGTPASYNILYIPYGETIVLSVTDPTAATYIGGSYSPFDYTFDQLLTTNYNLRVSHSIVYTNIPLINTTSTITAFTSSILLVDTTAGSVTCAIPTAPVRGSVITIKKVGGTNSLILNPSSTTTIDGALTKTTTDASASIQLLYVDSARDYLILSAYGTWT
jgi:hypothetical protein